MHARLGSTSKQEASCGSVRSPVEIGQSSIALYPKGFGLAPSRADRVGGAGATRVGQAGEGLG